MELEASQPQEQGTNPPKKMEGVRNDYHKKAATLAL